VEELIELRGEVPRWMVDIMDAVAQSRPGASRMSILREVLREWCEVRCHEATLIARVRRVTGTVTEPIRKSHGGLPE
jgi:hypothetical protein